MMISTGRPSRPPLALTSSRQISIAACSILPAGAPVPVNARLMPTLIGSAACAGDIASSNSAVVAFPNARRDSFTISFLPLKTGARLFLAGIAIRIDQRACLGFGRPYDRLCRAIAELFKVVGLRVLDLGPVH